MSAMTINSSMPRAVRLDRNLVLTVAIALLGLAATAVMLPQLDPASVAALSMLG